MEQETRRDLLIGAAVGILVYLVFAPREGGVPSPEYYGAVLVAGFALGALCPSGVHAGIAAGVVQPVLHLAASLLFLLRLEDGAILSLFLFLLMQAVLAAPLVLLAPAAAFPGLYLREFLRPEPSS